MSMHPSLAQGTSELDILMGLQPHELKARGFRFKHMLEINTGRLVATIATRALPDGSIQASAAVVNPSQGRVAGEESPSRRGGRREALRRLLEAKPGNIFTPEQARLILTKKISDYRTAEVRPADVHVVVFQPNQLRTYLRERTILQFFPGGRWVPPASGLRGRMTFKPRKTKTRSLLARFTSFFRS